MTKLLYFSIPALVGIALSCLTACGVADNPAVAVTDADSIYQVSNILKISYSQPELALHRLDTCEAKGLNSIDSICFYRGTLCGLLNNSDGMFAEWEKVLSRPGADVGSPLYLRVLKTEATLLSNHNQKQKALKYCLLGDSLARSAGNDFASLQFRELAATIGNEIYVQKENIEALERCVEESRSFLSEKKTFNTHFVCRDDLYDAYIRYNFFAADADKKDNLFLYNYECETKNLLDQVVRNLHDGQSNETLDYKYIVCYSHMIELLTGMGRKDEARALFEQKAKPLCLGASRILHTAANLAQMQSSLGDYDETIGYYTQMLEQSTSAQDSSLMMMALNALSECYEQQGDFRNAYQTLSRYHDLTRWKNRKDFLGQSSEFLTLYRVQEYEQAQREAENEAHIFRLVSIIVGIVLLLVVILLFLLLFQYRTIRRQNRILVSNINDVLDARRRDESHPQAAPVPVPESVPAAPSAVQRFINEVTSRCLFCNPDFDRDALLDELGIMRTGFSKMFEEETGQRFSVFLLNLRLEYAAGMIHDHPELTVDAIALDSGFSGRSTFYRNFTSRFGISPKVYRGELVG